MSWDAANSAEAPSLTHRIGATVPDLTDLMLDATLHCAHSDLSHADFQLKSQIMMAARF